MKPEAFENPEAGWAVYKTVFQDGTSDLEKIEAEQPFFSRENCEKRVEELNREHPDDARYLCGREDLRSPIRFGSRRFRELRRWSAHPKGASEFMITAELALRVAIRTAIERSTTRAARRGT